MKDLESLAVEKSRNTQTSLVSRAVKFVVEDVKLYLRPLTAVYSALRNYYIEELKRK